MKPFTQFLTEAKDRYDREGTAIGGGGLSHRGGTKIGSDRKKERGDMPSPHSKGQAKPRVKAIGGGKTAPAKDYKPRKDIGVQKKKSDYQQQPEKKRGSARLSLKDQQKKARAERMKANAGGKGRGDLQKAADKLLAKKKKSVSPKYKPQKASGYTAHERKKISRAGERLVKDIKNKKEKPASHYDPKL